jgi:hypothetical protein
MARGPRNTMASIRNHYLLLVASNFTRLTAPLEWVVQARASTAAGFLTRSQSANKQDLFVEPKGKGKHATLTPADLDQLQASWGSEVPGYGLFRERYAACIRRLPRANRPLSIAQWEPRNESREETSWKLMTGDIVVLIPFCPDSFMCIYAHVHTHTIHIHAAHT